MSQTTIDTASNDLLRQFEVARRELLELTTRNRLLNTPRDSDRGVAIEIKEESSTEIFRMLVSEGKVMRFEEGELVDFEDDAAEPTIESGTAGSGTAMESDAAGSASSTTASRRRVKRRRAEKEVDIHDQVLHTLLEPDELDRRLNRLVNDGAAIMQEQGVNVLYLALGFLRWFEPNQPDRARHAPLLLVPVTLSRGRGGSRYSVSFRDDDISTNITLKIRLLVDFNVLLPDLPDTEEIVPAAYFQQVQQAIASQPGWEVLADDVVLWFFSFSKLLMVRDLDPDTWPADRRLEDQALIRNLLRDGFPPAQPLIDGESNIDSLFEPKSTYHVIDCDSSQALVVEEAIRGRSMVIQGPPGTGKSQTITNLIAAAVAAGKKILFVSEKMAALEVVKRRLDNIGLGDMCLELHSNKTNKRQVLQEIERTLKLGTPQIPAQIDKVVDQLKAKRTELNEYVRILHNPFAISEDTTGPTPYQILTELIDLRTQNVPLPDFQIPEAARWSREQFQQKFQAVEQLADVIEGIGDPQQHPWRGSKIDVILPLDLERLLAIAPQRLQELQQAIESGNRLAGRFQEQPPISLLQLRQFINTVIALQHAPAIDPQPLAGTAWTDYRTQIQELVHHATNVIDARQSLDGQVNPTAWEQDYDQALVAYQKWGKSIWRMFSSDYRRARKTLRSSLVGKQPATFEQRLSVLQLLQDHFVGQQKLAAGSVVGERAFGRFWLGLQTDWQQIIDWANWDNRCQQENIHPDFRQLFLRFDQPEDFRRLADDASLKLNQFAGGYQSLCQSLKIDLEIAFDAPAADQPAFAEADQALLQQLKHAAHAPVNQIVDRLNRWIEQPHGLQQWQKYRTALESASAIGDGVFVERMKQGSISPSLATAVFRFAYAESVLRAIYQQYPQLESFRADQYEKTIAQFADFDIQRIELARAEIAGYHWSNISQKRGGDFADGVSLLRHEMQKKRRHLPLRELIQRAGSAIQAVKPVFMMSPISVAQYLEPGAVDFDLLLIDEASQVRPVEALGAAARCQQMIVVGDDKQMPPTQFFGRVVGEVDDEDEPEMQAGDVESILGLAIARNMPQRMLRWHYRSKHESLIAVSNREFYDNQLYVIPSPEKMGTIGVQFQFVEDGRFIKARNQREAQIVAQAVMQHAKDSPQWTLGVAAFSVSQRDAIISELEKLRRKDVSCEDFFDPSAANPFFIKNLENVQGDERDVVFVSVGYGPSEDGRVSMNFGPVSNSGGERRLNVLMTRAKQVLRIFSSMRPEEIDLNRATGRGPAVFREYLRYARDRSEGRLASLTEEMQGDQNNDRLIQVIKRELESRGYQLECNVGIAGVYVDLAVLNPDQIGQYLLGIAVDGQTYRSARSCRDRDRTIDGVLGAQGWVIQRVWSPEWFRRPQEQIDRLVEVIEQAKRGRIPRKSVRLASTVSQIDRKSSPIDPLAQAVGNIELAPPRSTSAKGKPNARKDSELWGSVLAGAVKAGAAILQAEKGKRLEKVVEILTEDEQKKSKAKPKPKKK